MKLQDLDKTKRYDLSECTGEELLCVLNWLKENDNNWDHVITMPKHTLKFRKSTNKWGFSNKFGIKPTFIQENKQDQFLNELQQLCKKYNTEIDAVSYDNEEVLLRIITDSIRKEIIGISGLGVDKFLTISTQ